MADSDRKDDFLITAAREAGRIGLSHFRNQDTRVWYKPGNSPVTEADKQIDHHLKAVLQQARPEYGWLSEEIDDDLERLNRRRVFIVDPIDGTRGFMEGSKEWCISIAIVEDGQPVEGLLHCPALDKTIHARKGKGVRIDGDQISGAAFRETPLVTGSKKLIHELDALPGNPFATTDFIPSLAYRLSLVATGELDGAFARQGASEWDIAAADIILREAGCSLVDQNGSMLTYNRRSTAAPALVAASLERSDEILALAKSHGILQ